MNRFALLNSRLYGVIVVVAMASVASPPAVSQMKTEFANGVVAADHKAASEAGAEILRQGGNVVDAAVATSFALSVTRPASCGIGGGGFMMIWNAEKQEAVALDYRERAPAAATRDMFAELGGNADRESGSVRGGKANAIPGTVAGLCYAAEKYGTLPLKTLLAPAIRLAKEGVVIDQHDISSQKSALAKFGKYTDYPVQFAEFHDKYLNGGQLWKAGDRFYSPQLAVLQKIADEGPSAFYQGEVAAAIVAACAASGGVITTEDLANSPNPVVRVPLRDQYKDNVLLSMPPASSGGIALLQTFQALEFWEQKSGQTLKNLGHNSADYVHIVAEAMKHAFADRAEFLGDTDYVNVPVKRMLSDQYAKQIAAKIDLNQTLPKADYGRFFATEDGGTSHFSVIDRQGNAVACTETINLTYGSFVVVPEWGILLNNEIDDFAARPGEPNAFGLMQSEANAIAPGKKPLSSMTPTIVLKDGRAVFSAGASGGPRIISATIQSTLNHLIFDMPPLQAVSAARFHHQWSPNKLRLEHPLFQQVAVELKTRGHKIIDSGNLAASQSVSGADSVLRGGSDPRKHGMPAGH